MPGNIPFTFVVKGVPRSLQSKGPSKAAWKRKVAESALKAWPSGTALLDEELSVTIVHFYSADILDVDNIIKPILDAMVGKIFTDDKLVTEVTARKTAINGLRLINPAPIIVEQLDDESDFVYVQVGEGPDHNHIT